MSIKLLNFSDHVPQYLYAEIEFCPLLLSTPAPNPPNPPAIPRTGINIKITNMYIVTVTQVAQGR